MSDQQQIAPCPFCGASGEDYVNVVETDSGYWYWVRCDKCVSEGPFGDSIEEAVDKWNTVRDKLAALEQKFGESRAKAACLEDRLAQARLAMSELCDAITARFSSEEVNGDNTLRLFLAYDAARKALEIK